VKVTDFPYLSQITRVLNGAGTLPNSLLYASHPSLTASTTIEDKSYIDASVIYGGVPANSTVPGIAFAATTLNGIATGTYGSLTYYNALTGGMVASTSRANSIPSTNASGTLDPSFLSPSSTYTVGGLNSASTTLTGTTTIAGVTVTSSSFSKFGGTGVDGALSLSGGATSSIDVGTAGVFIKNYTSISITGTSSLAFTNGNTNGTVVILKSQGNCTLTSATTTMIDLTSIGASAGNYGNGLTGGPGIGLIMGGTFGQPGPTVEGVDVGYGGQGKHVAASSTSAYSVFAGAGGSSGSQNSGSGGKGGGGLLIECGGSLNFTGTINANGSNGANGSGTGGGLSYCGGPGGGSNTDGGNPSCSGQATGTAGSMGAGGGGAGSTVMLYNGALVANSGTINITGGSGGTGTIGGAAGGNGFSFVGKNTEY
jgi:hypothetical protein